MVSVLIVEDHPVFRHGLAVLVDRQDGYSVAAQADGQAAAMGALRSQTIDLVLVDLTLEDGSGLSLVRSIRAEWPLLGILVLSMHDEKSYAERAFHAGANGYVMKDQPWADLKLSIDRVVSGQSAFSRIVWRGLKDGAGGVASLTDREIEVFDLLGAGRRIREVAEQLYISPKTVESHVASLKKKLQITHSNELVHRATVWRTGSGSLR